MFFHSLYFRQTKIVTRNNPLIQKIVCYFDDKWHRCKLETPSKCLRICSHYLLLLRFHPWFHPYTAAKRVQNREIHDGRNDFNLEPSLLGIFE